MKDSITTAFERAVAKDDYRDLRRSRHKRWAVPDDLVEEDCKILFHFEAACEQCGHRTWRPHVVAGRSYCRRCCPTCARLAAQLRKIA